MKNKRSIRDKILLRTLAPLLILSIVLGMTSVFLVHRLSQTDSEQMITQRCDEEALRFDNKLNLVSHSVRMIYRYALQLQGTVGMDPLSGEFEERIKDTAIAVANDTEGAMAVYFRLNPLLVGNGKSGFFWSRKDAEAPFTEEPPTDILAFPMSDVEHVGWFYTPKQTGEPMWMTPYYNKNIDVLMISYIIPMYGSENEFIGVIGMDIDFNSIMHETGNVKLYDSGRLALVDLTERIIYYCDMYGNSLEERVSPKLYNHVTTINKSSELLEMIGDDGVRSVSCCKRLSNGMILYLNVPLREINANRNALLTVLVIVATIVFGGTVVVMLRVTAGMIRPIKQLATMADRYATGNWDETFDCETGDELQDLAESISIMADHTRTYIDRLDRLVRIDALTGVNNRTSYMEISEDVRNNRHGLYDEYAVVVMDLNNLKRSNDMYGHDAGDALIREAAAYICRMFAHSPVFRIGGDEFVSLLTEEDYTNREAVIRAFSDGMGYEVQGVPLSISYGMAASDESADFDSVFKLADDRMYAKKREMHK